MSQSLVALLVALLLSFTGILGGGDTPTQNDQTFQAADQDGSLSRWAQVAVSRAAIREQPGSDSAELGEATADEYLVVLGSQGDWIQVRTGTGEIGWVPRSLLRFEGPAIPPTPPTSERVPEYDADINADGDTDASGVVREQSGVEPIVMGYYVEQPTNPSDSTFGLAKETLDAVTPWTWRLDANGDLVSEYDVQQVAEMLGVAGSEHMQTFALIHNYVDGSFDGPSIHQFLRDREARSRAVDQILTTIQNWDMAGVQIDFENVPPEDRNALTAFMNELAAALHPAGLKVTMAVPAKTQDDRWSRWSGAFDYAALGRAVDRLAIMAYNEHTTGGEAGPIASLPWVRNVLDYATDQIAPEKVLLGIPLYGYNWPNSGGSGTSVTYEEALALAQSKDVPIRWEKTAKAPYFTYGEAGEVWFEDRFSLSYKLGLVDEYNLGGIALWRIGQEDPGIWSTIDEEL